MNLGGRLWTQLFNVRHSHCPSIFHVAELLLSRDHPLRCPAISGWNAAVTVKKRGGLWVASESSSKIAELYGYSSHKQISGWWLSPTPLKNDGLGNSWDDEIPNWMESHKIPWFKITNQKWFVIHFDPFRETVINPQGPNNFGTGHRRGMARPTRPTTDFHSVTLSKISTRSTGSAPAPSPNGRHGHAVHGVFSHKTWQKGGKRVRFRLGDVGTGATMNSLW